MQLPLRHLRTPGAHPAKVILVVSAVLVLLAMATGLRIEAPDATSTAGAIELLTLAGLDGVGEAVLSGVQHLPDATLLRELVALTSLVVVVVTAVLVAQLGRTTRRRSDEWAAAASARSLPLPLRAPPPLRS